MSAFSKEAATRLFADVFAPWVRDLGLSVAALYDDGALICMPFSERLCREGGIVCGQALMALADTSMVFAVAAMSGRYRPMTTVDLTTHFMKPVSNHDVLCEARIIRLGRTMAFGRMTLTAPHDAQPIAAATAAYALLPESRPE